MIVEPDDVRKITGYKSTDDISDDDLTQICEVASQYIIRMAYRKHSREDPDADPDTGEHINGSNFRFQTKHSPIADKTGEDSVNGDDVSGYYLDDSYVKHDLYFTVEDAEVGFIKIYTDSGKTTAVPSTAKDMRITYHQCRRDLDYSLLKRAAVYYAAHLASMRVQDTDHLTTADLGKNQHLANTNPNRYLQTYKSLALLVSMPKHRVV